MVDKPFHTRPHSTLQNATLPNEEPPPSRTDAFADPRTELGTGPRATSAPAEPTTRLRLRLEPRPPARSAAETGNVPPDPRVHAELLFRSLQEQSLEQRRRILEAHDRFTSLMAAEARRFLGSLESWSVTLREPAVPQFGVRTSVSDEIATELRNLRERLSGALAEIDETRVDAARLQDERDAAIRQTHEVRAEYQQLLAAMEDHAARLSLELDASQRTLTDVRDQAREEAQRAQEQIEALQRELRHLRAGTEEVLEEKSRISNSSVVELRPKSRTGASSG